MKNHRILLSLFLACSAFTFTSCESMAWHLGIPGESKAWYQAKNDNTLESYDAYLHKYPNGQHVNEAKSARKTFSIVIIDFPSILKSRSSYYNIGGPVWVYTVNFRETNGVGATIDAKELTIHGTGDMYYWRNKSNAIFYSESQQLVVLKIPPHGTASYTSCVNSTNDELSNKEIWIQYYGRDDNGHSLRETVFSKLSE